METTSRSPRAIGQVWAWIGVGAWNPADLKHAGLNLLADFSEGLIFPDPPPYLKLCSICGDMPRKSSNRS